LCRSDIQQPHTISIAVHRGPAGDGQPTRRGSDVSGLTGVVLQCQATLNNLSHPSRRDLDILLVGPGGQSVI